MRFVAVTKARRSKGPPIAAQQAADSVAPAVSVDFIKAVDRLKDGVTPSQVEELIRQGALGNLELQLPWAAFEEMLRAGLNPSLITAIRRAADNAAAVTAATLKKALGYEPILTFDARNPRLQEWITVNTGELIKGLTVETKAGVKAAVQRALSEETGSLDTFQSIRRVIGLTERQSNAVNNFYDELVNTGSDVEDALQEASRYADRQLRYRADLIAQTETMVAANQGLNEGWSQAADQGMFNPNGAEVGWVTTHDDRLCPTCAAMDGVTRPFDGTWTVDIMDSKGNVIDTIETDNPSDSHPRCRCTSILLLS